MGDYTSNYKSRLISESFATNVFQFWTAGHYILAIKSLNHPLKALILTIVFPFQQLAQDQLLTLNLHIIIQLTILISIPILQDYLVYGMPCQSLTLINSPHHHVKVKLKTYSYVESFPKPLYSLIQLIHTHFIWFALVLDVTKFQGLQILTFYKYRFNDCTLVSYINS